MTTIRGTLERITFHNEENGFTVARLTQTGDAGDLTTIVGHLSGVPAGSTLALSGWWVKDARHGLQFKVKQYALEKPNTLNGMERYLGSGLIKGIGPRFAGRIVRHFGLETLDVLEKSPDRLDEVQGLGRKRIARIKSAWQGQKHIHEIMIFLQSQGISATFAVKIYKTYGGDALNIVQANPYRLAEDIWGIGFKSADRIALSMGIAGQDARRARAGLLFALGEAAGDGHCYLEQAKLISLCRTLLDPDEELAGFQTMVGAEIPLLAADKKIVADEERIYPAPLFYAEMGAAAILRALASFPPSYPPVQLDLELSRAAERMGVTFAPEQREALKTALQNRLAIITGGPGTGKSTILKGLLLILAAKGVKIELAAPTGRAAKRLSEACGREARTIHRLLEYDPSLRGFKRNSEHPLRADLIVVDEASMLDIVLANSLFKALAHGAGLLLVGDADQLPSVGPGNVLRDCIDSGVFPVARLTRIFRQGEGSLISTNAARINLGQPLELLPDYQGNKDFYFIKRDDPAEIEQEIRTLCSGRLEKKFGFDPLRDIQILTPMRKGLIGSDNLNKTLQQTINSRGTSAETGPGWSHFFVTDKVMQIRNNYDKEVFNGDIGFVTAKDEEEQTITVDFDGRAVHYETADLAELVLAYAITVHKSQGSEFKCIIVPIHTCHYALLQKNLLYTAVTRGKKLVILIGSLKAVAMAISNNRVEQRNSRLTERLRNGN
ncbi:MAG: ATP-dependent RecD-like DNA helicase [Deltaproteobacteria bacterium]|nr:ATP-dependent RecD-like DNA helicase [Deltaproteobacteria bacterium]